MSVHPRESQVFLVHLVNRDREVGAFDIGLCHKHVLLQQTPHSVDALNFEFLVVQVRVEGVNSHSTSVL